MTDLEVSRIAFGTWQLGGEWGEFDEREAIAAIRQAQELGVNLFDTAHGYGFGASERVLGKALRDDIEHRRDEVVIATKGGLRMTDEGLVRDSSADWLRKGLDDSLEALGADYVDLFQVHWPDPKIPFAETAGALQGLVDEGKIRHIGVSNVGRTELGVARGIVEVVSVQNRYSITDRSSEKVLGVCEADGLGFMPWWPLGAGRLPDQAAATLDEIAAAHDATRFQIALAWLLHHSPVMLPIPGTSKVDHLEENVAAASISLDADDLAAFDRLAA
jgi:pyridoxine 4-dehydrogenase